MIRTFAKLSVPRIEEKWEERKKNENFSFVSAESGNRRGAGAKAAARQTFSSGE